MAHRLIPVVHPLPSRHKTSHRLFHHSGPFKTNRLLCVIHPVNLWLKTLECLHWPTEVQEKSKQTSHPSAPKHHPPTHPHPMDSASGSPDHWRALETCPHIPRSPQSRAPLRSARGAAPGRVQRSRRAPQAAREKASTTGRLLDTFVLLPLAELRKCETLPKDK